MASRARRAAVIVVALVAAALATPVRADQPDLVALFQQFRAIVAPARSGEVPDYTDAAMAARQAALLPILQRLQALDDSAWPIADRVDRLLVLAEMRGLDFQYRVVRPWKRDPAFYSTTDLGFGPKIDGAMALPTFPLEPGAAAVLRTKLAAVPAILTQARSNLTEARGDLARLGMAEKRVEIGVYERLAADTAGSDPELAASASAAAKACRAFQAWLTEIAPTLPVHGGVGADDYEWYLRHVLLLPYTSAEMRVLAKRDYERSMVSLKLEEHRNRAMAMIEPATTLDEFERRRSIADAKLLHFLRVDDVMTVPDDLVPPAHEGPYLQPSERDPATPGPFVPPIKRHFFRQAEDRDPTPLRAHNVPGHLFDEIEHARDRRPIRGADRLFFVDGARAEGWSFYLEEMIQQIGVMDDSPKGREINDILQAKRAARVVPEIEMQANHWTYDEARKALTDAVPYWMAPDDLIAKTDLELYLRQPGYGIGYLIGKLQLEALFAEVAAKEGHDFDLKRFHDTFRASGMIPIALIRWEMTGKDDEIRTMR